MKMFRAQCDDCGVFELGDLSNPTEIIYTKYAPLPKAVVVCPSCEETVFSPLDKATAEIYLEFGTKVRSWKEQEITEDGIQDFLENFHEQIAILTE